MKKLSFLERFIFILNAIAAALLLCSYIIPYVSPKLIATISVLSLGMPLLLIGNTLFAVYWMLKLKKQFLLSLLILLVGYQHIHSFIKFSEEKIFLNGDIKIMSYNVRLLNLYKWSDDTQIESKIHAFIAQKDPDVISLQEFPRKVKKFKDYSYEYIKHHNKGTLGLTILSKYKIINKGSLDFVKSGNNAIFADIVIQKDTIRFYNIHLQSLQIDKNDVNFDATDSKKLLFKFKKYFKIQATQVELLLAHQKKCPYKTIIMGDFNNTAFSWVYKQLKNNKKDAFIEAGSGFGKSFDYIFPFRIDYILTDPEIAIHNFKTYNNLSYSDHYPIMARINLSK
jgi:endonuclease/exonuclease/phosphatase family metal-dependent hydrolase